MSQISSWGSGSVFFLSQADGNLHAVGETRGDDPNKLHDLKMDLDAYQVYRVAQIDELVALYLGGADRDKLDPILDACVAV